MCLPIQTKISLLTLVLLLPSANNHADTNDISPQKIAAVIDRQQLYKQATWLKLLHYKKVIISGFRSDIITASFFYSDDGETSPRLELLETIIALLRADLTEKNQHAQCRFPARFNWISSQVKVFDFPPIPCPAYEKWQDDAQLESISIVYASGYFENPASFYGHLLLKLNSSTEKSNLLETSINFGARVPDDDNAILYIVKGIFGGYESQFSYNYFYKNKNIYSQLEMRDLWEYKLNFGNDDATFIAQHIWELLQHDFSYYFVKQNCAYRIAELLELPIENEVINKSKPWILPIDVIAGIRNQTDLLDSIRYIPSKRSTFIEKYLDLDESGRHFISEFINNTDATTINTDGITDREKAKYFDALFDYYASVYANDFENSEYVEKRQVLLQEQFQLPVVKKTDFSIKKGFPHEGNAPSLFQVAIFSNENLGEGIHLRIRPAYYDYLSQHAGHAPYSALSMFDLRLTYLNERLQFHSVDLIRLDNLDIAETKIDSLSGPSWKLRLGLEPKNLKCISCTISFIGGGVGKAYAFGQNLVVYSFIEGRVQSKTNGLVSGTPKIGLIGKLRKGWHSHAYIGYRKFMDSSENSNMIGAWENRFGEYQSWDVRVDIIKHIATETSISLNVYW